MNQITTYDITSQQGDKVTDKITISNYGARIVSWHTSLNDEIRNIVLGYKNLDDYLTDPFYLGAIVGPYANRIGNSQCKIENNTIALSPNEGVNQLHGGDNALANQFWQCDKHTPSSVTLSCNLKDGFNGYPGNINVQVTYEISRHSELTISITVNSTKITIAGPTAHPYFNLNKNQESTEHHLKIYGKHYTPVDNACIPSGEIASVKNTSFDFLVAREVSSENNKQQLDHNFLLSNKDTTLNITSFSHANITSNDKKLTLHASSNYPAIQVYTGLHLKAPFASNQGICLEPQFSPDSPNQPSFPFHYTHPDKPLRTVIRYRLTTK